MVLWTLQRSLTGDYDARGVDESGTSFASGKVPAADAEKAIERTRAALTATVREVAPKPRDEGASGFGTNRRLGLRVRVRGADGTLERAFEGQVGSFLQERRIPLQIAAEALHALVDHFEWRAHAATDEERRAFVDRFLENEPRFRDGTARGTIATYLGAAVGMRARDLAPALLRMLASPAAAPVAHEWDLRASLLGALAALTPWDARTGADGGKLSDAEAAAAYVKQCGVTATAP